MLITAITPLNCKREVDSCENQPFTTVWPTNVDCKHHTKDENRKIKKRSKRIRTAFLTEQLRALEHTYSLNKYIDSQKRFELAEILHISEKSIKIWFQNRRMKEKRQSSESSSECSSESFGNETLSNPSPPSQYELPNENDNLGYQYPCVGNTDVTYHSSYINNNYTPVYNQTTINPSFYNDTNVYPTQYYPAYSYDNNNCYEQNINEINNYWAYNQQNPYYIPV